MGGSVVTRLGFVVHHDNDDHPVYTVDLSHERCKRFWDGVRRWHMDNNGWPGIAYSFGVCRHGKRFEGQGWWRNQFAGGSDQIDDGFQYADSQWYSVLAFLGGPEKPTVEMYAGITDLIAAGRLSNHCGLGVIPHNSFRKKTCPGPELTAFANTLNGNPMFPPAPPPPPVTANRRKRMFQYGDGTGAVFLWDGEKVIPLGGLPTVHGNLNSSGVAPFIGHLPKAEADALTTRLGTA
jgi:hypothetical protein